MLPFRAGQALVLISALAITPAFASRTHRAPTSGHSKTSTSRKHKGKATKIHGQRVIDSSRATEIQNALIKQKYLNGSATGQWDASTQEAMRQFQADHGWQTKLTPDSRALISLGLGPAHTETPAAVTRTATAPQDATAQSTSAEPPAAENSLAAVHSISQ
jgi:peptidoglycan hydrolase-like protein with peptidoglycan-binding domain